MFTLFIYIIRSRAFLAQRAKQDVLISNTLILVREYNLGYENARVLFLTQKGTQEYHLGVTWNSCIPIEMKGQTLRVVNNNVKKGKYRHSFIKEL